MEWRRNIELQQPVTVCRFSRIKMSKSLNSGTLSVWASASLELTVNFTEASGGKFEIIVQIMCFTAGDAVPSASTNVPRLYVRIMYGTRYLSMFG